MKVEYHVKTLSFATTKPREPPNLRLTRSKSLADSPRRPQRLRLRTRWIRAPNRWDVCWNRAAAVQSERSPYEMTTSIIPHLYVRAWPLRRKQDCTSAKEEPNGKPQTTCGPGQSCRSGSYRGESHTSHMWLARSVLDQRTRIRVDTSGRKKIKPNAICPPMSLISFSDFPKPTFIKE